MDRSFSRLMDAVAGGVVTPAEAADHLASVGHRREPRPHIRVDLHRESRTGLPEVIFTPGKTPEQVRGAAAALLARSAGPVIATKATPAIFDAVRDLSPGAEFFATPGTIVFRREHGGPIGALTVVTAGTSDIPVAEEAAVTAEACGAKIDRLYDVGVAGIHRLLSVSDDLRAADVIVVAAGMEGALPSVVGGLVRAPIVAVPTSIGYGSSFGGLTALLAMLNSCAPGVAVVNIDNGFGAGAFAVRLLKALIA